ncbi:MAG: phosphatase PAP2 family protein [Gammaproteobacteria bacterium]|nr:phosphatase PAP2 family protein [Gammaproteobacteria bacterium]
MKMALARVNEFEIPYCRFFNRINQKKLINRFFGLVSRLGDGLLWYTIMAVLPLFYGMPGLRISLIMGLTGIGGLLIYKLMKSSTKRRRPFVYSGDITQGVRALDQFSFPSGHTLHASGFATILVLYFPEWSLPVVIFATLVALSRLVLGLHYPSDVAIGAIIGYTLAQVNIALLG